MIPISTSAISHSGTHHRISDWPRVLMQFLLICCTLAIMTGGRAVETVTNTDDLSGKITIGKVQADRTIFAFAHGSGGQLEFELTNTADKPADLSCAFTLTERNGAVVRETSQTVTLAAKAKQQLVYQVNPDPLRYAVYDLDLKVTAAADKKQHELARTKVALGIISATKLRKANPGEFLYGLDPILGRVSDKPQLLEWTRVMGTDILRSPFVLWEGKRPNVDMVKEVMDQMPTYKSYGLRVMIGIGPEPPAAQQNWRLSYADYKKKMEDFAERLGQLDPDAFTYWELGNEPDIDFYPGPKEQYAKDYLDLYNAIKRSNPKAVVFNGGFAYDVDNTRKILQLIGPEHLDAVAYHAHGPGVGAERRANHSIRRILTALNFPATIPVLDTESGMDAQGPGQEITQATTAIEKMVFAQAQSMPFFMWFRLRFDGPNSYTSVDYNDTRQPRPCVLSYRATVETLRGLKYERSLDFGVNGLECHLFRAPDSNARCAVLWMNLDAPVLTSNVHLAVAANVNAVRGLQLIDMFGNAKPLTTTSDGRVRLTVDTHPIFVKWDAVQPDFQVAVGRPEIASPAVADLNVGQALQLPIVVRNPEKKSLTGTVQVAVHALQNVRVSPSKVKVKLAPGEEKQLTVKVELPQWRDTSDFPYSWRAFLYCDPKLNVANFTSIPDTVAGQDGKDIGWTSAYLLDNRIDLRRLAAKADDVAGKVNFKEKSPAVLFAELNSDTEKTITVGAAADWWMEWSVNGQVVYTTIPQGNGGGGYNIHTHNFKVNLKRGRNLFAVKVLSGSQGWQLCAGGPSDLAQGALENVDRLEFSLVGAKKRVIGTNTSLLNYHRPVESLAGDFWNMQAREWGGLAPTAKFGEAEVTNLFFKHPDSSRWWKGERDFSAFLWLRQDAKYLYTVVEVTDDSDKPAQQESEVADADSLRIALAGADGKVTEWLVGRVNDQVVSKLLRGTVAPEQTVRVAVERIANRTQYRIAIPRTLVNGDSARMNVIVNDNDNGYRKQYLSWVPFQADVPEPTPERWQAIQLR